MRKRPQMYNAPVGRQKSAESNSENYCPHPHIFTQRLCTPFQRPPSSRHNNNTEADIAPSTEEEPENPGRGKWISPGARGAKVGSPMSLLHCLQLLG